MLGVRILFTYENLLPNDQADSEQFVNTAGALARAGHEVELLVPRKTGRTAQSAEEMLGYYQVEAPLTLTELPSFDRHLWIQHVVHAARVSRHPKPKQFDLLYTRNLGMLTACVHRGIPSAYEHFRPWPDQFPPMQPWLRHVFGHRHCVGALFHSDYARQSYVRLGVPEAKLGVVHNGYEPKRMEPRLNKADARALLDLPAEPAKLVVYTGRMNERKGLDVAIAMARAARHRRDVHFVLVGSKGDGPIEALAAPEPNVHVRPWQTFAGAIQYLYAADVLLVPPSLAPLLEHGNTVLPIKLFIYLAAARAIFAPSSPDSAELLKHDLNACLVPPTTADAAENAAAALLALLDDPARCARLAAGAAKRAESLTWDARAVELERFLTERMNDAGPHRRGPWSVGTWAADSARWLGRGLTKNDWVAKPKQGPS